MPEDVRPEPGTGLGRGLLCAEDDLINADISCRQGIGVMSEELDAIDDGGIDTFRFGLSAIGVFDVVDQILQLALLLACHLVDEDIDVSITDTWLVFLSDC